MPGELGHFDGPVLAHTDLVFGEGLSHRLELVPLVERLERRTRAHDEARLERDAGPWCGDDPEGQEAGFLENSGGAAHRGERAVDDGERVVGIVGVAGEEDGVLAVLAEGPASSQELQIGFANL